MRRLLLAAAIAWGVTGAGPASVELGQPAPDFTLPDLAGKRIQLQGLRGRKAVVINFWATWCVPCREEMPTLERLARARGDSLEVLGVSVDVVDKEKVRAFVKELGLTFPILLDPDGVAGKPYRIRALPTSFVIDRLGIVRYREIGYRDWLDTESRYLLEEALRPR